MRGRSHPFDPMLLAHLAAAWIGGATAAAILGRGAWPIGLALAALACLAALRARNRRTLIYALALPALFTVAAVRYDHTRPHVAEGDAARYNDSVAMRIRGVLRDDPDIGDTSQRFAITVREIESGGEWRDASGGVLVRSALLPRYQSGDVLEIEGKLESPPAIEGFDYAEYLARKHIGSTMDHPLTRTIGHEDDSIVHTTVLGVRRRLSRALALSLPEPQASLAQGVLLGQRSALPPKLAADLNATNTSHLVVVSGENVVLVSAFATMFFSIVVGRRRGLALSIAAVVAYTMLIGASPPVLRAMIMGIVTVVGMVSGRPGSAITSLLFAASVMIGLDPQTVRDVSFQLSFAATAGILYLAWPIRAWLIEVAAAALRLDEVPRWLDERIAEPLAVTLAAIVSTSPLLALNFGRLSLVAIPANMLVVPAFPLILASSLVAGLGGLLPQARLVFAAPAYYALAYWIEVARWFASLPHAAVGVGGYSEAWTAVTYGGIVALGLAFLRFIGRPASERVAESRPRHPGRASIIAALLVPAFVFAATASWIFWPSTPARLHVSVLDVGEGDAILIRTPAGRDILVDGGPGRAVLRGLGDELPWTDRSIELLVLTHPQADHALGLLDVLARYDVRRVLAGPGVAESTTQRAWTAAVRREGIAIETARQGMRFDLGDGVLMEVLGPDEVEAADPHVNNTSAVLKITWGQVSFLLPGDIEAKAERALIDEGLDLRADMLKVAHHGSKTSSTREWLEAVRPALAAISSGKNNPFGHPDADVVARLDDYAATYNTAEEGAVRFETDGRRIWVDTGR